jgi:MtN3 and saliva related transmembrane protein
VVAVAPLGIQGMDMVSIVGVVAATCTTASYFPQLKKCWETGKADDLSLHMFTVLSVGIALWVAYGVMKRDWILITANSVSLACLFVILYFKLRRDES